MLIGILSLIAFVFLLILFVATMAMWPPALLLVVVMGLWFRRKWRQHVAEVQREAGLLIEQQSEQDELDEYIAFLRDEETRHKRGRIVSNEPPVRRNDSYEAQQWRGASHVTRHRNIPF